MRVLPVVLLLLSMIAPAAAQSLGKPGYGGPGCPGGTASVALSRDGQSLSVSFDRYQVRAKGGFDRKACSLSIPVKVPKGKSVSILAFEFRGYNQLPAGAKSTFKVEYFFAGGKGQIFTRTVNGPKTGSFSSKDTAIAAWSGCGAGVTLRTNSSLLVSSPGGKSASASIRAQDVKTAIVYRLRWRDC